MNEEAAKGDGRMRDQLDAQEYFLSEQVPRKQQIHEPQNRYLPLRRMCFRGYGSFGSAGVVIGTHGFQCEDEINVISTWFSLESEKFLRELYWYLASADGRGGVFCLERSAEYRDLYVDPRNVRLGTYLPRQPQTVMMPRETFFSILQAWLIKYNEVKLWSFRSAFLPDGLDYGRVPDLTEDSRAKLAYYAPMSAMHGRLCAGLEPEDIKKVDRWWREERKVHPDDFYRMLENWDRQRYVPRSDYWGRDRKSEKELYEAKAGWISSGGVSLTIEQYIPEKKKHVYSSYEAYEPLGRLDQLTDSQMQGIYWQMAAVSEKPVCPAWIRLIRDKLPWKKQKQEQKQRLVFDLPESSAGGSAKYRESIYRRKLSICFDAENAELCYTEIADREKWDGTTERAEKEKKQLLPFDAVLEVVAEMLVLFHFVDFDPRKAVFFPEDLDLSRIPGLSEESAARFRKWRPAHTLDALSNPDLLREDVYLVSDWIRKQNPKTWQTEKQSVYQPRNDWKCFDPYKYVRSEDGPFWATDDLQWSADWDGFTAGVNTVYFSRPKKYEVLTSWIRLQQEKDLIMHWWRLWEYEECLSNRRVWHTTTEGKEGVLQTKVTTYIRYGKKAEEVALNITRKGRTRWLTLPRLAFMEVLSALLVNRKLYAGTDMSQPLCINPAPGREISFPPELDYRSIPGLSVEAAERFEKWRPTSDWDALCIPGHAYDDIQTVKDWVTKEKNG